MPEPDCDGSLEQPDLQRYVPAMLSPEEHLERLRYDVDTVLQLQLRSYSDESWKPVANALAEYGYGVMKGWLFTRRIYSEVARGGFGSLPRCPESWLDEDTIQELAAETVAKALYYFKFEVLIKNKWDPTRGASLATFFVGQCKRQFANVYTVWRNDRADHEGQVCYDPLAWEPIHLDNPSDRLMSVAAAQPILDKLSSPVAREVFWKRFVEGQNYYAIATSTAGVKDGRAAQNLVFREKRRLKK
jgi:hypothetical protein